MTTSSSSPVVRYLASPKSLSSRIVLHHPAKTPGQSRKSTPCLRMLDRRLASSHLNFMSSVHTFWRYSQSRPTTSNTSKTAKLRQLVVAMRVMPAEYQVAASSVSSRRLRARRCVRIQLKTRYPASAPGATGRHSAAFHHCRHRSGAKEFSGRLSLRATGHVKNNQSMPSQEANELRR